MADTQAVVIYTGSPGLIQEIADCITEDNDGVEVTWDPAYEARSGEMIQEIVVSLIVTSATAAAKAVARTGVAKFEERWPGNGTAVVQEDSDVD
jgi:hypothetical protein